MLSTFGGAGGQHACAVADALGMTSVLIHPLAGALSAYGIGLADVIAMRETAVEAPLSADWWPGGPTGFRTWRSRRAPNWPPRAARRPNWSLRRRVHLRYEGTDTRSRSLTAGRGDEGRL